MAVEEMVEERVGLQSEASSNGAHSTRKTSFMYTRTCFSFNQFAMATLQCPSYFSNLLTLPIHFVEGTDVL